MGQSTKNDTVSLAEISKDIAFLKESILGKQKPQNYYLPWRGKQNERGIYVYPVVDVSASVLSQKGPTATETSDSNNSSTGSTGVGLEFGGSVIFVPGQIKGDTLLVNNLGLAFSSGFLASVANSDRYGAIYNLLGKVGVEIGNQHLFGFGCDFLAGCGKIPGDLIFYTQEDDAENSVNTGNNDTTPYTKWVFVYGGQVWVSDLKFDLPTKKCSFAKNTFLLSGKTLLFISTLFLFLFVIPMSIDFSKNSTGNVMPY